MQAEAPIGQQLWNGEAVAMAELASIGEVLVEKLKATAF